MSMNDADVVARQLQRMEAAGGVGGWKLMLTTPYAATPVGASRCLRSGAAWAAQEVRIEVELALVLGRDLPPVSGEYGRDEVISAIGAGHVAFEILCPASDVPMDPMMFLAEGLYNEAIVLGGALADWTAPDPATLELEMDVDGVAA